MQVALSLPVKSAILIDQNTGTVRYEMNADEKLPPASITKIMSLLLFMEALDSGKIALTDTVTCSEAAAGFGGSQIWLKPGEEMTVDDLLEKFRENAGKALDNDRILLSKVEKDN